MADNLHRYRFLKRLLPESTSKRLIVITGARQTGKTTISKQKYHYLKYINLDSPENRENLKNLLSASWADTIGNAVLDEAQKEPVVFEKVKYAFDEGGISFSVLTGSSQILLLKKIRESLAGRAFFYEMWPLMQCEVNIGEDTSGVSEPLIHHILCSDNLSSVLSNIPHIFLDKQDALCRSAEDHILKWGGMPSLLTLSEDEKWKWLKDYSYTYLERDLSDLARIEDLSPFRKFHKLSALRSGMLLNYSELARDSQVSVDTARRYIEYLRISFQAFLIQPYHVNLTSSAIKTPKIYWADIGILRQLTGFRGELTGELYETMVVSELVKWIKTYQAECEIYFYRTRSGMELDLLLESGQKIWGIEIKRRNTVVEKDIKAMKEIAQKLGSLWRGGMVVYLGDEIRQIANPDIWAVPSRRLFQ